MTTFNISHETAERIAIDYLKNQYRLVCEYIERNDLKHQEDKEALVEDEKHLAYVIWYLTGERP